MRTDGGPAGLRTRTAQIKRRVLPEISDHGSCQQMEMSSGVVTAPIPSFQRRGGRAAAGVVSKRSRSVLICTRSTSACLTTPSAALRWLRRLFLNAADTPPVSGGDFPARDYTLLIPITLRNPATGLGSKFKNFCPKRECETKATDRRRDS